MVVGSLVPIWRAVDGIKLASDLLVVMTWFPISVIDSHLAMDLYITFYYSMDVQASSVWEMYKELKDPRLSELADLLRDTVMKSRGR